MAARTIVAPPEAIDFDAIRAELAIPDGYPADAVAQARESARTSRFPDEAMDIPFVTLDPPGSRDLDQAVHLSRRGDGYLVRYAIAGGRVRRTGRAVGAGDLAAGRNVVQPGPVDPVASARAFRGGGEPATRGPSTGGRVDDHPGRGG
jgi:hypothetical protein